MAVEIEHSRLIAVEGRGDLALVKALMGSGRISICANVEHTNAMNTGGGIEGFEAFLYKVTSLPNFDEISGIVVLADSDNDQQNNFQKIVSQIKRVNEKLEENKYSVPDEPFRVSESGALRTKIILSPGDGRPGCLETILLQVLEEKFPAQVRCVSECFECAGMPGRDWNVAQADKAKFRTIMSVIHRSGSDKALHNIWRDLPDIIPINHEAFNPLCNHLCDF